MIDFLLLNTKQTDTIEFVQLDRANSFKFYKDNLIISFPSYNKWYKITEEESHKLMEYLAPLSMLVEVDEVSK